MQINLHHCKLATANLAQLVLNLDIDAVLIQEPYAFSGQSPSLADAPPGFVAFHDLSADHAYGAAILLRQSLVDSGHVKTLHRANHVACVEVTSRSGSFRFVSMYLRPSLTNFSEHLDDCFSALASPISIFGIDANAKSLLWNSTFTDKKGSELELLALKHKLNVMNTNKQYLDFVPGGTSFVDVSLAGDLVRIWFLLPFAPLSDHHFLYFEIESTTIPSFHPPVKTCLRPLPKVENLNQRQFLNSLKTELSSMSPIMEPVTEDAVSLQIGLLTKSITKCARAARTRIIHRSATSKNMPWLSRELCALRTKVRKAFKAWSLDRSEANRVAYRYS